MLARMRARCGNFKDTDEFGLYSVSTPDQIVRLPLNGITVLCRDCLTRNEFEGIERATAGSNGGLQIKLSFELG